MSDPAKDAQIRRDRKKRKRAAEEYEPVVLWVKPGRFMVDETSDGIFPVEEIIRRRIRDEASIEDFIAVKTQNEPRVEEVVTEFDTDE